MSRKTIGWLVAFVMAVGAVVGVSWTLFGTHELTFTQSDLQGRIDQKMPFTSKNNVTVSKVGLDLSDNKIHLNIDASATKLRTEYGLSLYTAGTVRYDAERGAFFFKPDTLKVKDVTANEKSLGEKVGTFVEKFGGDRLKERKAQLMVAAEALVQTAVQKAAEHALERVPVYTFPDTFKGQAARMSLKKVEIVNGTIHVTLSFTQLTMTVIGYILLGIVSLLLAGCLLIASARGGGLPFFPF
jgi:hypothetical protein